MQQATAPPEPRGLWRRVFPPRSKAEQSTATAAAGAEHGSPSGGAKVATGRSHASEGTQRGAGGSTVQRQAHAPGAEDAPAIKPPVARKPASLGGMRRTGALTILAIGFLASAVLRAGDVLAERASIDGALERVGSAFAEREAPALVEPARLLRELEAREAAVVEREADLRDREAALAASEARLRERLEQLRSARDALRTAMAEARGGADEDVSHLVDVYSQMKPAAAGALFDAMPPDFAAGFLARMPPTAAAGILAAMQADRAYALSVMLASRRADLADGAAAAAASAGDAQNPTTSTGSEIDG
ncbi:MAG: hypothetical protein AAF899_13890 [Pseudomonadota bacterium]